MENLNQTQIKKIFFIGIGGIGISALAKMALSRWIEVAGVNDDESPKTLDPLRELGVNIVFQKDFKDLPEADMYIYSDAWIYRGPEIIEQARATGKPVFSYFEALGLFAKDYKVIAIAGTHGKTTTTAMVADILIDAGIDPTVIVGSFVKKFNSNFRQGHSEYLVVEADEYNRHFLNFHPYIGAVTNIEADHLDCYKDLADIQSAFDQFLSQSKHTVVDYSKYMEKVPKLSVPGEHNRKDAAVAYAVAEMMGVEAGVVEKSLANFAGTWRRLEKKGATEAGTIVYDDYAHHPTEVQASLQALRELYPEKDQDEQNLDSKQEENDTNLAALPSLRGLRHGQDLYHSLPAKNITVVFQPHLYSRTKALFEDFTKAFDQADRVMLLPIYFAREDKDPAVSSEKLADAIETRGVEVSAFPDFIQAEEAVRALNLGPNDVLVTMGAGEAYKVVDNTLKLV